MHTAIQSACESNSDAASGACGAARQPGVPGPPGAGLPGGLGHGVADGALLHAALLLQARLFWVFRLQTVQGITFLQARLWPDITADTPKACSSMQGAL